LDGPAQHAGVPHGLLQQVGPARDLLGTERRQEARRGQVREQNDPEIRHLPAEPQSELDAIHLGGQLDVQQRNLGIEPWGLFQGYNRTLERPDDLQERVLAQSCLEEVAEEVLIFHDDEPDGLVGFGGHVLKSKSSKSRVQSPESKV
jgi:hypothetical protein